MKKNVLVTGSTGFIGTCFIKNNTDFAITEIDLLTIDVSKIDFTGINSVLHLAGLVHQMKGAAEQEYFRINRDLAYEVAFNAKNNGVKHFLLMSTVKVFGELTIGEQVWNEDSYCNPKDSYGKSKYEAEKLIKELEDKDFKVSIVRSPLVYGPGVKANMLNFVKLVDRVPILPFAGIKNLRSVVYVENLVELLNCLIDKQSSGIYIAGDLTPVSTLDLVRFISKALGKRRFLIHFPKFILKFITFVKPKYYYRLFGSIVLDNSFTKTSLNFVPPFSTEYGIQVMVDWYNLQKKKEVMI